MKVIWKFPLQEKMLLPKGALILKIDRQGDSHQLWAMVDPNAEKEQRRLFVLGTGQPFDDRGLLFINTFQDGPFVWHVFERNF